MGVETGGVGVSAMRGDTLVAVGWLGAGCGGAGAVALCYAVRPSPSSVSLSASVNTLQVIAES